MTLFAVFTWSPVAAAGSFGLGLSVMQDLPTAAVPSDAAIGLGLGLQLPLRLDVTSHAALRFNGRLDYAGGSGAGDKFYCKELDVVSWKVGADTDVRAGEPATCGWLVSGGLTVGPEVYLPIEGNFRPYLAGGVGLAGVGNFHDLERIELFDLDANNLSSDRNIDPYSIRAAIQSEVYLGVSAKRWFAEVGYSAAWVPSSRLYGSADGFDVQRDPYGWNGVRFVAGVAWPL